MSSTEKMLAAYDNALLGILQNEGKLESFLDVIFGFLCRRTDFFLLMKSERQKYGFPPGVAEKMVFSYFKKYQNVVLESLAQAEKNTAKSASNKVEKSKIVEETKNNGDVASAVTSATDKIQNDETKDIIATEDPNNEVTASPKPPTVEESKVTNTEVKVEEPEKDSTTTPSTTKSDAPQEDENKQAAFQNNPDSYNGAIRDNYCWSQNYDDVDVKIPVEKSVARAKQVVIEIERKRLKVLVKKNEKDEQFETVINDELQHEVNREESMWSLESGKHITITLTKDKNIWWSMLLKNEEEIDIQKICPERPMQDMDEEEKAVINKLQFDDRQKKLGLPQSHELKVHDMLKKGWDAEGSPFKGQDFDPKMFNISPGAVE